VHDRRITLWRDYVDLYDMLKATFRGVAGIVVPSLRETF
jgi:limonene-1,2-epoxide hydrolase